MGRDIEAEDRALSHQVNVEEMMDRARNSPWCRVAIGLVERGLPWEHAMTVLALALDKERERLLKELTRMLELNPAPPVFPLS